MIQFKRGKTSSWRSQKVILADGQPGYDKTRHKIKIGNGKSEWKDLPFASGLSYKEVLDSEENAKKRLKVDSEDATIFTYGKEAPDKSTVGNVYLQYYNTEPETDYVIEQGASGIWTYQKMRSGIARCWGNLKITADITNNFEGSNMYYDTNTVKTAKYPFTFKATPNEVATLHSPGGVVWLANKAKNTTEKSGLYCLISLDKLKSADYSIALAVTGYWR